MIINKNNCKCKVTIQPETIVQIMRRVYASVRHTGCAISSHRTSHAAIALHLWAVAAKPISRKRD